MAANLKATSLESTPWAAPGEQKDNLSVMMDKPCKINERMLKLSGSVRFATKR